MGMKFLHFQFLQFVIFFFNAVFLALLCNSTTFYGTAHQAIMPNCYVPRCTSGQGGSTEKVSLFRVPVNDAQLLHKWQLAIPRQDRPLKQSDRVCAKHFQPTEILQQTFRSFQSGKIQTRCVLSPGSVPSIFPNCPHYLSKKTPKSRKVPVKRNKKQVDTETGQTKKNVSESPEVKKLRTENSGCLKAAPPPPAVCILPAFPDMMDFQDSELAAVADYSPSLPQFNETEGSNCSVAHDNAVSVAGKHCSSLSNFKLTEMEPISTVNEDKVYPSPQITPIDTPSENSEHDTQTDSELAAVADYSPSLPQFNETEGSNCSVAHDNAVSVAGKHCSSHSNFKLTEMEPISTVNEDKVYPSPQITPIDTPSENSEHDTQTDSELAAVADYSPSLPQFNETEGSNCSVAHDNAVSVAGKHCSSHSNFKLTEMEPISTVNEDKVYPSPQITPIDTPSENSEHDTQTIDDDDTANEMILFFESILLNFHTIILPNENWFKSVNKDENIIIFQEVKFQDIPLKSDNLKTVFLKKGERPILLINNKQVSETIFKICTNNSQKELENKLLILSNVTICERSTMDEECDLIVKKECKSNVCLTCRNKKRKVVNKMRMQITRVILDKAKMGSKKKEVKDRRNLLKENRRYRKQIQKLKKQIHQQREEFEKISEQSFNDKMSEFPENYKRVVHAIFNANQAKGPSGVRYDQEWVYQCLLMRIQSPKLYKRILRDKVLPVPTFETLRKYSRGIKSMYGFQNEIFDVLKEKLKSFPEHLRHGMILVDEMKLTKGVKFDKLTCEMQGLVDMGQFTPENQKNTMADHALVFMFQPFQGNGVQALACFATAGNAPKEVLAKMMIECVLLCENSGMRVDGFAMDGATWNRSAMTILGVKPGEPSIQHPVRVEQRLWFMSDFCHLIKCGRNALIQKKKFKTPDGDVDLKYWEQLARDDETRIPRRCLHFSLADVYPKGFQLMNVGAAMRFFGTDIQANFQLCLDNKEEDFAGCESTIQFVKRINKIIQIMNNKNFYSALKPNSEETAELESFLQYLEDWETMNKTKKNKKTQNLTVNYDHMFAQPTMVGLKMTIKATLELLDYLHKHVGYEYLLTRKLNQDALENFFSLIRAAGGCSSHPQPTQFAQLFRLLMFRSIARPPKGSNVSSAQLLTSLLTPDDVSNTPHSYCREELETKLDELVDKGDYTQLIIEDQEEDDEEVESDHNYHLPDPDLYATGYISGYVCRRSFKFVGECKDCEKILLGSGEEEHNKLTKYKTRGYLKFSSKVLYDFIYQLESNLKKTFDSTDIHKNYILDVISNFSSHDIFNIGCPVHEKNLTRGILKFYIIFRMYALCNTQNAKVKKFVNTSKQLVKMSRLVT